MQFLRSGRDFAAVGRQISAWTTNFLASAIVLVMGLALGWQVLAWWREESLSARSVSAAPVAGNDVLSREFATTRGLVRIERVRGTTADALAAMKSYCLSLDGQPLNTAEPARTAGPAEVRLIERLNDAPILQQSGKVALYQPPGNGLAMAAVDQSSKQIVAWSTAIQSEENVWSVYYFQPGARQ